jgi:hypothetical protein
VKRRTTCNQKPVEPTIIGALILTWSPRLGGIPGDRAQRHARATSKQRATPRRFYIVQTKSVYFISKPV